MTHSKDKPDAELAGCHHCKSSFRKRRKDQKYCSDRCRKDHHQKKVRSEVPCNSKNSHRKRRSNLELFDSAKRLAEILYNLPPFERLGFMKELVDQAREGSSKLRGILTNAVLLKPDYHNRRLFYRGQPRVYLTIAQAAEAYCRYFWSASVADVVYGRVSEPPTGETPEAQNVVTISI